MSDIDERFAVFLGGWSVHHDKTATSSLPPEVTPETRVTAGRSQRGRGYDTPALGGKEAWQLLIKPDFQLLQT
jgi:hypothetical protein